MRVLISGFAPFGGREINPTELLINAFNSGEIPYPEGFNVRTVVLPVTFEDSFLVLQNRINEFNPDVVIALGQAAGRKGIELESIALNKIDADIMDNAGQRPQGQLINDNGPEKYGSTLPLQGMESALKNAGLPVAISNSAGTFVCNYLFYRLMEENQETLRFSSMPQKPC
jgi:pyroglutamyl-peptidase